MQEDMKKLIAYSSVAHMGFVTMGIFSLNKQGIDGAMFQMISHGFVSGALFLCVGVVYDRMHTREIAAYGGLVNHAAYAAIFMLFTMANVGLPGTSGFVGEFLTLMGAFQATPGSPSSPPPASSCRPAMRCGSTAAWCSACCRRTA
jgi:NADH-quinone oxidoreductase subunit M